MLVERKREQRAMGCRGGAALAARGLPRHMMGRACRLLAAARGVMLSLALIALFAAAVPYARDLRGVDDAAIAGRVRTEGGDTIAAAAVEIRNVMSGTQARTTTDAGGNYEMAGLRQGRYAMRVEAAGYNSVWIPNIFLYSGEKVRRDVILSRARDRDAGGRGGGGALP
ncbi:MAG: carboxypeptidase regulatory-like domain-containing protein [Acidobacteria bacterium]|nr:carboxypeptidase regulatory-like domain-containing protein [Acidobacteriota bacterium]MBI3282051.1 carboxypeptidase regulatory-like domain-containing protein [Acidobacteriota bacterium]